MAQTATSQTYTTTERMNECGYRRGKQPKAEKIIVTVTVTKIVTKERAEEYVGLGWLVVGTSNTGTTIRWSGGEHDKVPEPKTEWDRMWSQPFDRPELIAGNGAAWLYSKASGRS